MSVGRTSLGICTDANVKKVFENYRKGLVKAGEEVVTAGKSYFVGGTSAHTKANNALGEVRKSYHMHNDGNWYLHDRTVRNNRGSYTRRVDTSMGLTDDIVSLGGQQGFIRQPDGTYLQKAYAHYPARIVSSNEIEAAIDYVKGKGSVENYTRLLRDYR